MREALLQRKVNQDSELLRALPKKVANFPLPSYYNLYESSEQGPGSENIIIGPKKSNSSTSTTSSS